MSRTYLDAASGQPLSPAALSMSESVRDIGWASPNGLHHEGKAATAVLQAARETIALVAGCDSRWVTFLPRPTAARTVMSAVRSAFGESGVHWGVGTIETQAVRDAVQDAARGADSRIDLPTDPLGRLVLDVTGGRCSILVAQATNSELGTMNDLDAISNLAMASGAAWVCDATGLLGYQDNVWTPNRTVLADAHGFAGPADVSVVIGEIAHHELFADSGVSVTAAATTAAALFDLHQAREADTVRLRGLIDRARTAIHEQIPDVDILGDPVYRTPHTVTVSFLYADGERLANELDRRGIAVGSGSACASRVGLPSHVLVAIGALTHGNVRISLPRSASEADIDVLMAALPDAVAAVRRDAGAP